MFGAIWPPLGRFWYTLNGSGVIWRMLRNSTDFGSDFVAQVQWQKCFPQSAGRSKWRCASFGQITIWDHFWSTFGPLLAHISLLFETLWAYLVGFGASRIEVQKSFDFTPQPGHISQKVIPPWPALARLGPPWPACGHIDRWPP